MTELASFRLMRETGFQGAECLAHPVTEPLGLLRLIRAKGFSQVLKDAQVIDRMDIQRGDLCKAANAGPTPRCGFRGEWALISRDAGQPFHGIVGRLADAFMESGLSDLVKRFRDGGAPAQAFT